MNNVLNKEYEYKFSVIMAVYNTEKYVAEAIDSIINQSIGFEENIQLILVNDGSTDKSGEICKGYRDKYPNNIVYEEKENGGASDARNVGRKHVKGKYLNFFDSDDIWSKNTFEDVYSFFEANYNDINLLSCKMVYLEKKENNKHPLDFKYDKGNRIIDLDNEFDAIQVANGNVFFKSEAIEGVYYDTSLKVAEDAMFIESLLLHYSKYGVVSSAIYKYRKREDSSSLSDRFSKKKAWYLDIPEKYYCQIVELSKREKGYVPYYIQYMIMYDMQWRIKKRNIDDALNDEEKQRYTNLLKHVLQDIDDGVIYGLRDNSMSNRLFWLNLKYGYKVIEKAIQKESKMLFGNKQIFDKKDREFCKVSVIELKNNKFVLEGTSEILLLKEGHRLCCIDDKNVLYQCELKRFEHEDEIAFNGEKILEGCSFYVEVPASVKKIRFTIIDNEGNMVILNPQFVAFSGLNHTVQGSYRALGKYLLKLADNNASICVYNKSIIKHSAFELKLIKECIKRNQLRVVILRFMYYIIKPFFRKPIWIVRDRNNRTGENGEQLFKFLSSWEDRNKYNIYFMLEKDSMDYNRVKKYGKILDPNSIKYMLLFMISDKIIDSMAVASSINPFGKNRKYYQGLFKFDYVFLAHGIAQRDMSSWTNKFKYNIKLHITGVQKEYDAVLRENNGYTEEQVKLTGLPRYDELYSEPKNLIVFMPTWRADIAGNIIKGTTQREYVTNFKDTEYFTFYNKLINDARLIEVMKKKNYKGVFYNHPSFEKQSKDFNGNSTIAVSKKAANVTDVLKDSSMMITDYSSVFFETAYLKKPVLYCQFDKDKFYDTHTGSNPFFDYETEGFGPVCKDFESTVKQIIEMIENDCKLAQKYEERIDRFFKYQDRNNCRRVVEEIIKLDERKASIVNSDHN